MRPTPTTKHEVPILKDTWNTEVKNIAFSHGRGSDKDLSIQVRFDGNGNSVVRFVVKDHEQSISYEKYDAAVEAYNRLP